MEWMQVYLRDLSICPPKFRVGHFRSWNSLGSRREYCSIGAQEIRKADTHDMVQENKYSQYNNMYC